MRTAFSCNLNLLSWNKLVEQHTTENRHANSKLYYRPIYTFDDHTILACRKFLNTPLSALRLNSSECDCDTRPRSETLVKHGPIPPIVLAINTQLWKHRSNFLCDGAGSHRLSSLWAFYMHGFFIKSLYNNNPASYLLKKWLAKAVDCNHNTPHCVTLSQHRIIWLTYSTLASHRAFNDDCNA